MKLLAGVLFLISLLSALGIAGLVTYRLYFDGRLTSEQKRLGYDIDRLPDPRRRESARNVLNELRRGDVADFLLASGFLLIVQVAYIGALVRYFRSPLDDRLQRIFVLAVVPCLSPGVFAGIPFAIGGLWLMDRRHRGKLPKP